MGAYYFSKVVDLDFENAIKRVTEVLSEFGFGVLTEIDVTATLKKKLNVDFPKYRILGACHPPSAYKALSLENKIGTMLPCNVIVQQLANGDIEVSAVDPVASMGAVDNPGLAEVALPIRKKLIEVIEQI